MQAEELPEVAHFTFIDVRHILSIFDFFLSLVSLVDACHIGQLFSEVFTLALFFLAGMIKNLCKRELIPVKNYFVGLIGVRLARVFLKNK